MHGVGRCARAWPARAELHDRCPKNLSFRHPTTGNEWPNDYGCQHAKFFIVGFADGVRVVVHTANIIKFDMENKSEGVFAQDFPLKAPPPPADGAAGGADDALVAGAVQQALLHLRASRRECAEELRRDAVAEDHAAGDPHEFT